MSLPGPSHAGRQGWLAEQDTHPHHAVHKRLPVIDGIHVAVPHHDVVEAVEAQAAQQQLLLRLNVGNGHDAHGQEDDDFVQRGHGADEALQHRGHAWVRGEWRQQQRRVCGDLP